MIKLFEEYNSKPEVGDYVIIDFKNNFNKEFYYFINNTIGLIDYIIPESGIVGVKYENIPKVLEYWFSDSVGMFNLTSILEYDKNREKLELIISAKKYNL